MEPASDMNNLDLDFSLDPDALTGTDDVDFSFFDGLAEDNDAVAESSADREAAGTHRPYHSKRPHRKSRAGCKQCKARKVKCDEGRPACRACTLRKETCVYPTAAAVPPHPSSSKSNKVTIHSSQGSRPPKDATPPEVGRIAGNTTVVTQPMFVPAGVADMIDMKMLWFYTTETYVSFNVEGRHAGKLDHVLKNTIVEHAFKSPFLMQTLLGLSALHLKSLGQGHEVPQSKAVTYRALAFEGYRNAIEAARPQDYAALLACSLLMCALSSEMFREEDTKPLYVIDWMLVWRGIGVIVDMITPQAIQDSGMSVLFYRPPINLEKSAQYVPNNLLFMVSSIKPDDDDYEHQQTYYDVLRYLGSLYMELTEGGFSPIMDLRTITFFTFMPRPFIPLAKEHRPRALIILAHYCAFAKLNRGPWWMLRIADRQIKDISEAVGEAWAHLLHVPRKVMFMNNTVDMARTILDNDMWTAPAQDLYAPETRDPRVFKLTTISDDGQVAEIVNGQWRLQPPSLLMTKLNISDPESLPSIHVHMGQRMNLDPTTPGSAHSGTGSSSPPSPSPFPGSTTPSDISTPGESPDK